VSNQHKSYISVMLILSLIMALFSSDLYRLQANAIGSTTQKLYFPDWSLSATTGITDDLIIGHLPEGTSINEETSTIACADSTKFSFTSDDGSQKDWTYRDTFASRGVSCTLPLVEDYVTGRISTVQIPLSTVLALQNEYGYEIGSHSYDHKKLTEFSSMEEVLFQLTESKRLLTEMGLHINNFYVPFGAYTPEILEEAAQIYRAVRTSDGGMNTPLNKSNLKVVWLDVPTSTLDTAKQIVDDARASHDYVIFGFHAMVASQSFMDDTVGQLIDYIQSFEDTQVLTVDKALDRMENVLQKDIDYKIIDGNIVLDKFFLRSLPIGVSSLSLAFSDGTTETVDFTIQKESLPRHRMAIASSTLTDGPNQLDSNQTIVIQSVLDTNMAGDCTSTASIGTTSVEGVLNENFYTYTFYTNDMLDGLYDELLIESNVGEDQVTEHAPIQLSIEKTISEKAVASIEITTPPDKTEYLEGDPFLPAGMTVIAHYEDGSFRSVTNYTTEGFASTPGIHIITVRYADAETTLQVSVAAKAVSSISITKSPTKLTYHFNEPLDLTGLEVTAYYNNSTWDVITDFSVSGNTSTSGSVPITITSGAYTTQFNITVKEKEFQSIAVTKPPNKLTYYVGDALMLSGIVVTGTKTDLTTATIYNYTVSEYNMNLMGTQTITVSFELNTASFEIEVLPVEVIDIEIRSNPNKTVYLEGEPFETAGLVVAALYNNGTAAVITDYTLSGYTSTPGIKTISVSCQNVMTAFNVSVIRKQLTRIAITHMPDKLTYIEGFDEIDLTGMIVTAYYNNNTSAVITGYYLDDYSNTLGAKTITVIYSDLTATFSITVTKQGSSPSGITSSNYNCNTKTGYLSKIGESTTVNTFLSKINEKSQIKIFKGTSEVKTTALVGTGMKIKLMNGNTTVQTLTVVITGDINGDGNITLTDFVQLKSHLLNKSKLTGSYSQAADINGDGKVTLTDYVKLKAHILNKEKITPQSY